MFQLLPKNKQNPKIQFGPSLKSHPKSQRKVRVGEKAHQQSWTRVCRSQKSSPSPENSPENAIVVVAERNQEGRGNYEESTSTRSTDRKMPERSKLYLFHHRTSPNLPLLRRKNVKEGEEEQRKRVGGKKKKTCWWRWPAPPSPSTPVVVDALTVTEGVEWGRRKKNEGSKGVGVRSSQRRRRRVYGYS